MITALIVLGAYELLRWQLVRRWRRRRAPRTVTFTQARMRAFLRAEAQLGDRFGE